MHGRLGDAPEVEQALAKADECEKMMSAAETDEDREFYDRMRRKWIGIAEGWRFIVEVGERR
jgi:hypothetical protein